MAGAPGAVSNLVGGREMKTTLGTIAALAATLLAVVPAAAGAEQTRETYKAQVEPICEANRKENQRIMAGARQRVNKGDLETAGKQFIRASGSIAEMAKQLDAVPAPVGDERRVSRWLQHIRLLKTRLHNVGKYFKEGEEIKGTHESILAERAGLSANNTSIVFHFRACRFNRIG